MATPPAGASNTSRSMTFPSLALEPDRELAGRRKLEVCGAILIAISMPTNHDWLRPAGNQSRHIAADDRLAKDDAAYDVSDGAVGRTPHLFEIEFLDAGLVRCNGRALDADAVFLDCLGGIDRDLVLGSVALFDAEVVIVEVDIQIGVDQLVFDELPHDPGHLIAVEFNNRA